MLPTIGIIPAAGKAERMGGLPKFLLPTPTGTLIGDVCKQMRDCGAVALYVGTSDIAYSILVREFIPENTSVFTANTKTMSETVLHVKSSAQGNVLFGMPDSYFKADYSELLKVMDERKSIAAAGCFRIRLDQRGKLGGIQTDKNGFIVTVADKSPDYGWCWGIMTWTPEFWKYIKPEDPHVGYALADAVKSGERIPAVLFGGDYYDCGTRDEYFRLCAKWHKESKAVTA